MGKITSQENRQSWKNRVEEWQASGLSLRAWCSEKGISASTFAYWRKLFSTKCDPSSSRFVELPQEKMEAFELECHGVKIKVGKDFDENLLFRCLQVMRSLPC